MFFVVRSNDSFNFPLGWIKYIVIVVTIFSVQALSSLYSLWVYNVLYSLFRVTQMYTVYGFTMYYILSVQADSIVYSLWVCNVLFSLSKRTRAYTVYGFTMYYFVCPGGLQSIQFMVYYWCTILTVQADWSVCSAWTQRREVLASTTTWAWWTPPWKSFPTAADATTRSASTAATALSTTTVSLKPFTSEVSVMFAG